MDKAKTMIIILCIVCTGLVVAITVQMLNSYQIQKDLDSKVTDFSSCALLNNKVQESYPRRCVASNGKTYTENICVRDSSNQCLVTKEFTSEKGITAKIYNWNDDKSIKSPFVLMGEIPGSWSFEAVFTADVVDNNHNVILQEPATLQSNWMTDSNVPFATTLEFNKPTGAKSGYIILHKANPSGLSKNDDKITIPVKFN